MRLHIVHAQAINRCVNRLVVEVRCVELRNLAPRRHRRGRHVLPRLAGIARDVDQPIVRPRPDRFGGQARRRKRIDYAAPRGLLLRLIGIGGDAGGQRVSLARKIGADGFPRVAAIGATNHHLHSHVHHVGIDFGEDQRHSAQTAERYPGGRPHGQVLDCAGDAVEAAHGTASAAVNEIGVERVGRDIRVLFATHRMPFAEGDLAIVAAARHAHRSALLLAAIDVVGDAIVGDHVVELRGRLVIPGAPRAAVVHAERRALVGGEHNDVRVDGIDPDGVIVVAAGSAFDGREGLARHRWIGRSTVFAT